MGNGRLEGPFPGAWISKLLANGEEVVANSAYRFGVQQADKLRAVGDLKWTPADATPTLRTPTNLPSWGHSVKLCELFRFRGKPRPVALAKADCADACKRLPPVEEDELSAAVTLGRPVDRLLYRFIHETQLFGFAAAVKRYTCLSRAVATMVCSPLKLPRVSFYEDFGTIALRPPVHPA